MLSDLLHSALEVLRSVPEDIWYDGIDCMLSARYALHIPPPKEGATRMLIVALAKDTLSAKQQLCPAGIHRKCPKIWRGAMNHSSDPGQFSFYPYSRRHLVKAYRDVQDAKPFKKPAVKTLESLEPVCIQGHTFIRAQWASWHCWGRPGDYFTSRWEMPYSLAGC